MSDDLDRIDHAIIGILATEGRIAVTTLADRVGLSKTPCQARMKRLEANGYILGYQAVLNHDKLDRAHVAFVEVKLSSTRASALEAFNKTARTIPEIEQCHMIAGGFDYLLKIRTRNIDVYRRVLGEKISALPYVAQTSTYVSMQAVKERDGPAS